MAAVFGAVFFFSGASNATDSNPIKIGFVGGLTGKSSDLGIQGRNGAMLAVEDINRQGGINGRPLHLITKDDKQDPQTALKVDKELIDAGVIAIIGHITSTMTEAVLPFLNERKLLLISPTASTNKLTGIDDYLVRVINPNIVLSDLEAEYAGKSLKLGRMAILYDLSNRAYSEDFAQNYQAAFERLGGKVISTDTYSTGPDVSFKKLAQTLLSTKPDGVLIVARATDTAMICQHIRMAGSKIPIFISGFAQTPDLLRHGGPAVEGIIATMYVDHDSAMESWVKFKERYRARFGEVEPTFVVVMAYETVMVVQEALSRNPDPKQLKEAILKQQTFQGLQGPFEIDAYGDAKRKAYVVTVRNHRFTIINK